MLDPTFSYNRKRKLLASGTIKVEGLNATPTGNLPEADVAKVMDRHLLPGHEDHLAREWTEESPPPQDLISLS